MNKRKYIRPEVEIVVPNDPLMFEVTISNYVVDDEAAKQGNYDNEMDWDSHESIWGKPSGKDQNWDEWSGN